jgi:pSer/pThr/pTyr-binding forkhead associated (FHA) protein
VHEDDVTFTRILGPVDAESASGGAPAREHPALVWRTSAGDEQVFELEHRVLRIGRHDQNDVMLAGPTVSTRHATVRVEPVGVVIEDEGSLNGTFVNGVRIEQQLLEDGDRIQIGPHQLVFAVAADDGSASA